METPRQSKLTNHHSPIKAGLIAAQPSLRHCPRSGSRASVLFELVLAVLIFGMAALALARALHTVGSLAIETKQASLIQAKTHSLLMEHGFGQELVEGEIELPDEESGVMYRITVEPVEIENMDGLVLPDLFQVTVTADWEENGGEQQFSADTVRYAPLYR